MEPVTGSIFITIKSFYKITKSVHYTENIGSYYRRCSHRCLHQATTTELITPPTILKIPATKLSANCVKNAFRLNVKNIPIKK